MINDKTLQKIYNYIIHTFISCAACIERKYFHFNHLASVVHKNIKINDNIRVEYLSTVTKLAL